MKLNQDGASYSASLPTWSTSIRRLAPRFLSGWLALLLAWVGTLGMVQPQRTASFAFDSILEAVHATVGEDAVKLLSVASAGLATVVEASERISTEAHKLHELIAANFATEGGSKGGSYHSALAFRTLRTVTTLTLGEAAA
jgi:hypothetical protein